MPDKFFFSKSRFNKNNEAETIQKPRRNLDQTEAKMLKFLWCQSYLSPVKL